MFFPPPPLILSRFRSRFWPKTLLNSKKNFLFNQLFFLLAKLVCWTKTLLLILLSSTFESYHFNTPDCLFNVQLFFIHFKSFIFILSLFYPITIVAKGNIFPKSFFFGVSFSNICANKMASVCLIINPHPKSFLLTILSDAISLDVVEILS